MRMSDPATAVALAATVGRTALAPPVGRTALAPPVGGTALAPPVGGTALAPPVGGTALAPPVSRTALAPPVSRTALATRSARGTALAAPAAPGLSPTRLGQIAGALAARVDDWSDVLRFDSGRRWYRRLVLDDDHEVWLLTWLPGQATGFHDHGRAAGAFAVARGRLRERIAAGPVQQVRQRPLTAGGVRAFGARHVHDVANVSGEPAVSVHAYSPPLTAMRRYDLTPAGLVHIATQSAEQGW
jgi:predicted metal-dependent enzyme (double-stranded beta helix superfamily)